MWLREPKRRSRTGGVNSAYEDGNVWLPGGGVGAFGVRLFPTDSVPSVRARSEPTWRVFSVAQNSRGIARDRAGETLILRRVGAMNKPLIRRTRRAGGRLLRNERL